MAGRELLAGRYAVERELGRGASGRVLLALDQAEAGAARAIKLVAPEHEARLRWEFGLLSGLSHPNLARVYELLRLPRAVPELEVAAGAVALVSEFAPGRPAGVLAAEAHAQRDVAALVSLALLLADGVSRALGALHARALVHGDVKPDNIVIDLARSSCKLIDLGLAGGTAHQRAPAGTLGYIAPEVLRGERGAASDMYALGVTLHEVLRGAPPEAHSRSHAELLTRALQPPSARAALPAATPPALARLIEELLDPDPSTRLSHASELRARVGAIAHEQGVVLQADVGGGADDAASPAERALSVAALPLVGHAAALRELTAALARGGCVAVVGASGSGRSRVVREAVREVQLARVQAAARVPTYRASARLPDDAIEVDTVLHVAEGDAVSAADAEALLAAAAVEGCALTLVLERSAELEGVPAVALAPLAEGDVRRLLEHALPGARIGSALVREALSVSAGLSGRLCRVVAGGLSAGQDMSRAASLRAFGSALHEGTASLPEAARELADLLAVAGGVLGPSAAQVALGSSEALADGYRGLVAAGLATRDGDRLELRADWAAAARAALPAARLLALATRLPDAELDGRAQAHVLLARGDRVRAYAAFLTEVARLRAAGQVEQAVACAREALLVLGELDRDDGLRCALGDALRAQGRYADARAALGDASSAPALVLRAEVARLCGERDAAQALVAQALAVDAANPSSLCEAEAIAARLAFDAGELDRALALAERAAARADAAPAALLRALEVVVLCRLHRGEREAAARALTPALDRARQARARAAEARLTSLSAQLAREDGDVHAAARGFAAAFEAADAAGEQHAAAAFLHNVGAQRLDCGEPGPAIAALREAARRLARLGRQAELARALYNLGHAAQVIGADDLALSSAERAQRAAIGAGDAVTAQYAACLRGELWLKHGERKQVALLLAGELDAGKLPDAAVASVLARRAMLHLGLGEHGPAAARLEQAEAAARAAGSDASAIEPSIARAQFELERGTSAVARAAAEHAVALAQRAGSLDTRLRASLLAARALRADGDAALSAARLAEVRSLLDHAARSLAPAERARLRAVDAYRAALEALPSASALALPASGHDERWRTLAGIVKRLTAERRLSRLYEIVLDAAIELSGAERGYLLLRDRDGLPRVRAARGIERKDALTADHTPSRSIVARVLGSGRALSTMDAASDDQLSGAASVHALSLRSVLAVPLRIRGEVVGAIDLEDRLRPFAFGDVELALVSDLADLASIALDSAQLLRAERRDARRLSVLRARLSQKVEVQAIELASLKRAQQGEGAEFPGIIAHSRGMQRVLGSLGKVARSGVPVLIRGESGTGKELIAHALHEAGPRKLAPFVSENCGAIPEPLLESALFGHVRGAFTGADRRKVGLFEAADGGTLFLDEIAEMSPAMQTRLLRVLQDGEVRPVGGDRARHVDVRVLCATHRDLEVRVKDGSFREDLYYRIAVVTVALPPLRERAEDISPLCAHFIEKHAQGKKIGLDRRALAALSRHAWPGNVRQLENEIRRALVMAEDRIDLEHLSPELALDAPEAAADPLDLRAQVDQLERRLIRQALSTARGNHTRAARALGVSRYGLQKMIRRLELGADDEQVN